MDNISFIAVLKTQKSEAGFQRKDIRVGSPFFKIHEAFYSCLPVQLAN